VEAIGFPRHRRKEGHRQPIKELRILALDPNAIAVAVDNLRAFQPMLAQVDPGLVLLGLQALGKVTEANHVIVHQAEDRRMQAWMRQALEAVHVVFGYQFTGIAPDKLAQRADSGELPRRHALIDVIAIRFARKCRMRLITDAGLERDHILGEGDLRRIGICGKRVSLRIDVIRLWHSAHCGGRKCVGTLQVVILQRRLIDLRSKRDFVLAVGLHRVQMFGPFGKGAVEDVFASICRRIGIVPCAAASREQQDQQAWKCATHDGEFS
jgi:hypothetical protein